MGLLSTRKKLAVLYVCLWWYYWQNLAVTGQWENIQVFKFTPKHFEPIIVDSLILSDVWYFAYVYMLQQYYPLLTF